MRYLHKLACAAALMLGMTTVAGAAEGLGNLPPQGAKAYLELIQAVQQSVGTAHFRQLSEYDQLWEGLFLARLIDFDGDKIPELYYVQKPANDAFTQQLYTYQDGKVVQLPIPKRVSNFSTDVNPVSRLYIGQDKAYLVDGLELMNGNDANYFTKKGNDIVSDFVYNEPDWNGSPYKANGKVVTKEELESQLKQLTSGMTEVYYSLWAQKNENLGETVTQTVQQLKTLTNPTAVVSTDKLMVNGKSVDMPVYKIGGSNYYMLRGLAQALSDTEASFAVGWDAARSQITLTKGEPYTPVGNKTDTAIPDKTTAVLTSSSVQLDGQPLALTAYNIGGNNFFKLRDLGQALNFSISWNEGQHTISIDTAHPYE